MSEQIPRVEDPPTIKFGSASQKPDRSPKVIATAKAFMLEHPNQWCLVYRVEGKGRASTFHHRWERNLRSAGFEFTVRRRTKQGDYAIYGIYRPKKEKARGEGQVEKARSVPSDNGSHHRSGLSPLPVVDLATREASGSRSE